ncbi:MAG: hypothetical protein HC781_18165 [Leptolyngbyaceae cyanobacterium CSU_1_4]|nr:hypothetical protein [Leptolyngbyaceae cyanobacterium CSU_1_4]
MKKICILQPNSSTGHQNPDKLLKLLNNWKEQGRVSLETMVKEMGFKSPAPLLCCLDALEKKGLIRLT